MKKADPHICANSLRLLADYWSLRVIESLVEAPLRYCALQRAVGNVNPATLTKKLNTLEITGLIRRREKKENGAVVYELTALGKKSIPVLKAIDVFSRKLPAHSAIV